MKAVNRSALGDQELVLQQLRRERTAVAERLRVAAQLTPHDNDADLMRYAAQLLESDEAI